MSCVGTGARLRRLALLLLVGAGWVATPVQAAGTLHFNHWVFDLPDSLVVATQTPDRLVLKLAPGLQGQATLTFYSPRPLSGDPGAWLDQQWRGLTGGRQIAYEAEPGEAALMDGTSGLRRSANTGKGDGILQADAYVSGDSIQLLVADTKGEAGMQAWLNLFMSLRLDTGAVPDTSGQTAVAEAPPPADNPMPAIKPPPSPGEDPYDRVMQGATGVHLHTTSDLDEIPLGSAVNGFIKKNANLMGHTQRRPVAFADAMNTVRGLVSQSVTDAHMTELRNYAPFQDRNKLLNSAALTLMQGMTSETLARMQLAYERWPDDPDVLFENAALLSQLGKVNESLAILDEMNSKHAGPAIGFGIQPQSAMDYLRGYNLMQAGQYAAADQLISGIVHSEPDFAMAALTEALLAARLGKKPITFYITGYFRRQGAEMRSPGTEKDKQGGKQASQAQQQTQGQESKPPPPPPENGDELGEDDSVVLAAPSYVDLSRGKPGNLPPIYQPTSIDEALRFQEWNKEILPGYFAEADAMREQSRRLNERWRSKIQPGPLLDYYEEILRMFSVANARMPQIQRLLRKRNEGIQEATEAEARINDWFGKEYLDIMERNQMDMDKACPAVEDLVTQAHAEIRVHVQYVDTMTRRTHRLWHQYATALGSMVGDRDFRNYLKHEITYADLTEYHFLVSNMWDSTVYAGDAKECIERKTKREWAKDVDQSDLAPCDDDSMPDVGAKFGPVTVSLSCDGINLGLDMDAGPVEVHSQGTVDKTGKVTKSETGGKVRALGMRLTGQVNRDSSGRMEQSFGAEGGLKWLTGKGEVKFDNRGSTSFYAGGKVGGELDVAGVTVGASQESGVEMTVSNGEVSDVALKSTSSVEAKFQGQGLEVSTTRRLSFMPGPGK